MDIPAYCSFAASNRAVGNVDVREGWNHYFYHNPDGHWVPIPWDLDMMFMPKTQQSSVILQKNCVNITSIGIEYKNRCRELLDLMLAESGTSAGQIGQLIDEYAQMMNPTGQALTWADLDAAMWNKNPRTVSTPSQYNTNHYGNFFKTPYLDTRIGGNWNRTLATSDHEGFMKYLLDYSTNTYPGGSAWTVNNGNQLGYGYKYTESDAADTLIPNRPSATYTGPAGYPLNDLRFTSGTYSSPRGAATFSAIQWRIAEISAPGIPLFDSTKPRIYELTDVWRSAEIASTSGETRIPGGYLTAGHTYRVRLRHKDNTGRWSRWSTATEFIAGAAAVGPYQASLVISKIMYNPTPASDAEKAAGFTTQDFEFIELKNVGTDTLDLGGVSFTAGITFSFPADTTLAPGATILVVKNVNAFNLRYGSGLPVAGAFASGNLDNGGETITLSLGTSGTILSFAYSDGSHPASGQTTDPWPTYADGGGYALVLLNPSGVPNPGVASNWRISARPGGSPGADDTITYAAWLLDHPGTGSAGTDTDLDCIQNLMEYAGDTNPLQPTARAAMASGSLASLTVSGTTASYLTYSFRRQIAATDITYHVEFSPGLGSWSENGVRVSSIPNGDGTATELWRTAQPAATSPEKFIRLRVTQP